MARRVALAALLYVAASLMLQWRSGAFEGTWGEEPDEPAHFLNGVMALDYLRSGFPQPPLPYARSYYEHYPKIALGHWPPLFAAVEAAWFTVAPLDYRWGLALVGLLAAATTLLIAVAASNWAGPGPSFTAGLLWLLLPPVRTASHVFLAELLLTLLVTAAVAAFAWRSRLFGVWSALALLTKGTAIALALLPPAAAAIARDGRLLRQGWLWLCAALVLALAGPWYLLAPDARHERVAAYGGLFLLPRRIPESVGILWDALGPALCGLAMLGVALSRRHPLTLAAAALIPGSIVLRVFIGAWEGRHLVILTPACLWLALAGWCWIGRQSRTVAAGLAVAAFLWPLARLPQRTALPGAAEAAQAVAGHTRLLVAGGAPAEGALLCEIALRDPNRPSRTVARASKLLASSDFLGRGYQPKALTPEALAAALQGARIQAVLVETPARLPHEQALAAYLATHPEAWRLVGRFRNRFQVYLATPSPNASPE